MGLCDDLDMLRVLAGTEVLSMYQGLDPQGTWKLGLEICRVQRVLLQNNSQIEVSQF